MATGSNPPPANVTDQGLIFYLDALGAALARLSGPLTPQDFLEVLSDRLDRGIETYKLSDLDAASARQLRDRVAKTVRIYQMNLP